VPPAIQAERRPVTVLATRRVHAGREREFEDFLQRLQEVFAASAGFLGLTVLRPVPPSREYVLVYRYDTQQSLRRWRDSAQRRAAIAESGGLAEAPPKERSLIGMETWFTSPGEGVVHPPARWKIWLLSTCGIYPIITTITVIAGSRLAQLPPLGRFAVVAPLLSAIMTWLVMPGMSRLFALMLYRQ